MKLVVNLLESDPLSSYPCGYPLDTWTCFDQAAMAVLFVFVDCFP